MHNQNEIKLLRYKEHVRNLFFLYKNLSLVLIFVMTFNSIDSPARLQSSWQTRYVTVWYCLICIVPNLTYKNLSLVLIFVMTFNSIDSPARLQSSWQTRYVTVWYCLICIVPNLTSRLPSLFSFFFSAEQYTFCLVFSERNAKFVICKPIPDIRKIFVKFLLNFFDISVVAS